MGIIYDQLGRSKDAFDAWTRAKVRRRAGPARLRPGPRQGDRADHRHQDRGAFFGARSGKPDLTAAIADVASYKASQAVFAPAGAAKGLTKVFNTGAVPNPAFVDLGGKQPASIVDRVAATVVGYGGSGAITGWTKPSRDIYTALAGRLGKMNKAGVLANPELVRIDAKDAMLDPATIRDTALVDVRHHFVRPSGGRME